MDNVTYSKLPRSQIKSTKWEVERSLHHVMRHPEMWGDCNVCTTVFPFGSTALCVVFSGMGSLRLADAFVGGLRPSEVTINGRTRTRDEHGVDSVEVWVWPTGLLN